MWKNIFQAQLQAGVLQKDYPYGPTTDAFPEEKRIVLSLQTMPPLH